MINLLVNENTTMLLYNERNFKLVSIYIIIQYCQVFFSYICEFFIFIIFIMVYFHSLSYEFYVFIEYFVFVQSGYPISSAIGIDVQVLYLKRLRPPFNPPY